ncbi:autotransporter secretion outer membrane protein TamA [Rhodovulum bhavnagarense]|uniref:Autotransporter secretion outer membrane protein TamA n=1 Tax=Rhodovulum bhavnagarense TaxID=992286 RepID=A0A4R2RHU0_9RHOB|nr:autotransporter assembly complex family protein [Rhodovulum bhavnagarense]TCP63310.1 autotransporter secretion outer membrane protein TamA [Rhodovulum bhavnagarense]
MTDSPLIRFLAVLAFGVLFAAPVRAIESSLSAPGVSAELRRALAASALSIQAANRTDASAQEILATARADYSRLIGVLYAHGYFGPVIHIRLDGHEAADIAPLALGGPPVRLQIDVDPGPPFTFGRVAIGPLAAGTELPDGFALGMPAATGVIRKAAEASIDGWRGAGHAKAAVEAQSLMADHGRQVLDADLRLAPGPVVRFGRLDISGQSAVRPERLRDIAGLPEGARFDPEAIAISAERLRRTGAFASVRLQEAETLGPGNSMDIALSVADAKPRRLGLGGTLSSLEGMTLSGFWLHRNLLGGAERLRFDAEISGLGADTGDGVDARLSTRFDRPATFDPDTGLFVHAALETLDEPDYREDTGRFGVGLAHVFSDRLSGDISFDLHYSDVTDDLGQRDMSHVMLPIGLSWDGRDDPLDPREGVYFAGGLTPIVALGGGAESGLRMSADARAYRAMGERVVLAGRLQLGAIAGASTSGVPSSLLFFSGGGGSVRGQPYQSLAVDLGGGNRVGGRAFAGLSTEARVALTGPFGVVAFADAGYVAGDLDGSGEWHSGAGVGVRYDTGFGPIRLDIAGPVGGTTGDGLQLYIGIGQAF